MSSLKKSDTLKNSADVKSVLPFETDFKAHNVFAV